MMHKRIDRTRRYSGRNNLKIYLKRISSKENLRKFMYREGHKEYEKINNKLKKAGINIDPYVFQTIRYLFIVVSFIIVLAIGYTNVLNNILNADKLSKITEMIGEDSTVAQVKTNVSILPSIAISLLGFFIPDIIVSIIAGYRKVRGAKEITMLHTYAVMMLKSRRSVKQILISLKERSVVYKHDLELAVNSYSRNPNKALQTLIDTVGQDDLKKVFIGLMQALNNDTEISIIYLENHRTLSKELNKINRKKKNTQKSTLGLIMMVIPLIVMGAVGGYPWLLFALKQLSSVPV